jgi:hypothetical protein
MGVLMLVALVVVLGFVSLRHEAALTSLTTEIFDLLGLPGLLTILFVSDAIFSPIPPDAVLVVLSRSPYHQHWLILSIAIRLRKVVITCSESSMPSSMFTSRRFAPPRT